MQLETKRRTRIGGTVAVAGAHFWLAVVGMFDRLNYTVPPRYAFLEQVASNNLWVFLHLSVAILLVTGLFHNHGWEWRACATSVAVMGTWGFFNLLWGLTAIRPVSLAAPGLAALATLGAQILADAWMQGRHDKGR